MTTASLVIYSEPVNGVAVAGQVADHYASASAFADYQARKAQNTRVRQAGDLAVFARFLKDPPPAGAGIPGAPSAVELGEDPAAWAGVSWGLVEAFVRWQLGQGYAVGSINCHLATVKTFCNLASKAGAIPPEQERLISTVKGFGYKEARNIDANRDVTRLGYKKAEWVKIPKDKAAQLKAQPDTPQGRRDAVMMCLLLDHGLRASELAGLVVSDIDLGAGVMTFYRQKTGQVDTHRLSRAALAAVRAYFAAGDAPAVGPLLRGSRRGGQLEAAGMTRRAITARVEELGRRVGLEGLSAHDCRHAGATDLARRKKTAIEIQQWGGWASIAMAARYVERSKIANESTTDIWEEA